METFPFLGTLHASELRAGAQGPAHAPPPAHEETGAGGEGYPKASEEELHPEEHGLGLQPVWGRLEVPPSAEQSHHEGQSCEFWGCCQARATHPERQPLWGLGGCGALLPTRHTLYGSQVGQGACPCTPAGSCSAYLSDDTLLQTFGPLGVLSGPGRGPPGWWWPSCSSHHGTWWRSPK